MTARAGALVGVVGVAVLLSVWLLGLLSLDSAHQAEGVPGKLRTLVDQLCSAGSEERARAKQSLIEYGPGAVGALAAALDSDGSDVCRASIAEVLAAFGRDALPAAGALVRRLKRGDSSAYAMAYALGELGDAGIALLSRVLGDCDSPVALLAALGRLSDFEAGARDAMPAVVKLINSQDSRVRVEALSTLQSIGSVTRDGLLLILAAAKKGGPEERSAAAGALSRLCDQGNKDCIRVLVSMLQSDEEHWVRAEAAKALGVLGTGAQGVREALMVAADDPDSMVRTQAREALPLIR